MIARFFDRIKILRKLLKVYNSYKLVQFFLFDFVTDCYFTEAHMANETVYNKAAV